MDMDKAGKLALVFGAVALAGAGAAVGYEYAPAAHVALMATAIVGGGSVTMGAILCLEKACADFRDKIREEDRKLKASGPDQPQP